MSYKETTLWFCNKCGAGVKNEQQQKHCNENMKNVGVKYENEQESRRLK